MAPKVNKSAFEHAQELIKAGKVIFDQRPAWSEHQPSSETEDEFIRLHGLDEYGKWHLGIEEGEYGQTKRRYTFPYGDFENVHRCAVTSAESTAGQHKLQSIEYHGIENAAAHLHGMIDAIKP